MHGLRAVEIDSDCHTQKYLSRPSRQEAFSALSCQIKGSIAHLSEMESISKFKNLFVRDMVYFSQVFFLVRHFRFIFFHP